jgi:hypothetical protein
MIVQPEVSMHGSEVYLAAGDQFGDGWWGDRWSDAKKLGSKIQSSQTVRDLEKGAVKVGSRALRGVVETGLDGVASTALTAIGAPELAPMADKLIDKGASYLEKKGVDYVDQKIDKSGEGHGGVRYMSAGGGMRLAGSGTRVGNGMRLAGGGMRLAGDGMRLAGGGMRLAGSGVYARPLLEGSGCCQH